MSLIEAAAILYLCNGMPVHNLKQARKMTPAEIGEMIVVDKNNVHGMFTQYGGASGGDIEIIFSATDMWIYESTATTRGAWVPRNRCPDQERKHDADAKP